MPSSEEDELAVGRDNPLAELEPEPDLSKAMEELADALAKDQRAWLMSDEWLQIVRSMDDYACEFVMDDMLFDSYLWWDDDSYRASELGPGLEEYEGRALNRFEAGALVDGCTPGTVVPLEEVEDA